NPVTFEGHAKSFYALAYSPDGRTIVLSGEAEGTARIWDAASGRCLRVLSADKYGTCGIAISPDGTRIASAGSDQTIKLWDIQTGQQLIGLRGHPSYIWSVAFSPDGRWLASSDDNGLVKLWDGSPVEGGTQ